MLTSSDSVDEEEKDQLRTWAAKHLELAGPQKVDLVVLPQFGESQTNEENKEALEIVTRERKELLAANIENAFYERKNRKKAPKTLTPLDDASILALCSTCRGACCKSGRNHAYLTRSVLDRVKTEGRVRREESLLQSYLDLVPKYARKNSCIFHGSEGCTLPRSMRSETCNRYLCYAIDQLGNSFSNAGYAQLAVASDSEGPKRIVLLSEGKTRQIPVAELSDVNADQ